MKVGSPFTLHSHGGPHAYYNLDPGEKLEETVLYCPCAIPASAQDECGHSGGSASHPHSPKSSERDHAACGLALPKYRSKTASTGVPAATSSHAARNTSRW